MLILSHFGTRIRIDKTAIRNDHFQGWYVFISIDRRGVEKVKTEICSLIETEKFGHFQNAVHIDRRLLYE